jgi:negative regulator of replication initiation
MKKQICILIEEELLEVIDSKRKTFGMSRSDIITPVLVAEFTPKQKWPTPRVPLKKGV